MQYIRGEYCFYLNLDDLHNPELPLIKNRSAGGTLCFWKKQLDPYVTVISVKTQSFLPVILKLTNFQISVHIALYLPTHSKDTKFISDLAELGICIEELTNSYPEAVFYIRGDGNVNSKNVNRVALLEHFLEKFYLTKVIVPLPTYPTFVGNGMFDSNIDIHQVSQLLNQCQVFYAKRTTLIFCPTMMLLSLTFLYQPNPCNKLKKSSSKHQG